MRNSHLGQRRPYKLLQASVLHMSVSCVTYQEHQQVKDQISTVGIIAHWFIYESSSLLLQPPLFLMILAVWRVPFFSPMTYEVHDWVATICQLYKQSPSRRSLPIAEAPGFPHAPKLHIVTQLFNLIYLKMILIASNKSQNGRDHSKQN